MRTSRLLTLVLVVALAGGLFAQATDADPNGSLLTATLTGGTHRGHGDLVAGPWDVETPTFDNRCLGVEYAWGFYWVTGAGHTTTGYNYMFHKFDTNGNYLASYPQPNTSAGIWGGRDMEADDATNTLWVGEDNGIVDVMTYDPVTGGLIFNSTVYTSVVGTVRALCRNPNTGTFFTKSFTGTMYEFDMATGAVINSFTNTAVSAYGFGWDYAQNTIWSSDSLASATELDPTTGQATGRGFNTLLGGSQGGVDVYNDSRNPNGPSLIMLHQTTPDSIALYDTSGSPPPPPPVWPNLPTSFATAAGMLEDFESYAGVVPPHMAVNELNSLTGLADPEAWCNIGQHALAITTTSGVYCLEMGLDPASTNYHDVRNGLVVGLNGAGAYGLELNFQAIDHGEEVDTWDGVWVSDDGVNWTRAYGPWTPLLSSWQAVNAGDLTTLGVNTGGDFYLLFAQDDNFPYGYLDGIGVDDMSIIDPGPPGPTLAVSNLVAGGTATLSVSFCTPNGTVRLGYSLVGGGPITTPFGDLLLSPPYTELPPITCDAAGNGSLSANVPAGTSGIPVWIHAFDLGSLTFTNGLAEVIG
ncbi:MAG: hypothetical protein D6702_08375 [Planctomycetota bacterium]|nr:MAG: hypothetical protein D6702_08375 [Planctomycetota bacterium]